MNNYFTRTLRVTLVLAIALIPVGLLAHSAQSENWNDLFQKYRYSVAQVINNRAIYNFLEPFKAPRQDACTGTAFFINAEGDMLTNNHVVENAGMLEIQFPDLGTKKFKVEIVGTKPERDVALLRLTQSSRKKLKKFLKEKTPNKSDDIHYFELGDSDTIETLQPTMALGYPLTKEGLKSTVGSISGFEAGGGSYSYLLQTTTPINPGNSGGPLLSENGDVIGINSCGIHSADNTAFAIPITYVKVMLNDLRENKLLRHPVFGLLVQQTTQNVLDKFECPEEGVLVTHVISGSPAEKAGYKPNDIIIEMQGYELDCHGHIKVDYYQGKVHYSDLTDRCKLGDTIVSKVRRNKKIVTIETPVEVEKTDSVCAIFPEYEQVDYIAIGGLVIQPLKKNHIILCFPGNGNGSVGISNTQLFSYFHPDKINSKRLVVTQAYPACQASEEKGIAAGSIIKSVNGVRVETLEDFKQAALQTKDGLMTIESEEFGTSVFEIDKLVDEDRALQRMHHYPESDLLKDLAAL